MSQFKIAFLGTPDFAVPCLQKLIDDPHFDVVGVVTQPDRPAGRNLKLQICPVKELALKNNLPVVTPEKIGQALDEIREWQAEAAVVVAFGQILPKSFLEMFQHRVVNVHASLLPLWRGAAPIQRSIMAGDTETGVSLQVVVPKLDAGPVLGIRKCDIETDLKSPELYARLKLLGPELLEVAFPDWLRGHLAPQDQDESQVSLAPKIKKEEGLINWSLSSEQIYNNFRGLYGWPGSYFVRTAQQGTAKQVKVKACRPVAGSGAAGKVTEISANSFVVACGKGQLEISSVQPESKSEMKVSEYLKGYPLKKGEQL